MGGPMKTAGTMLLLSFVVGLVACAPAAEDAEPQSVAASDRVLKLEELTYPDIDSLDRESTIFFLTFGNLEEHGPHVPVGSDYFQAVGVRDRLIARLQETHPDYTFVLVPVVPLGEGGADDLARRFKEERHTGIHVGTFPVRFTTLRDVAVDLGASIARKGFQNIFLIHSHGAPLHNVAFSQSAAFVSERYNVRMVNVTSLVIGEELYSSDVLDRHLGEGWQEEIGITGHAGTAETSANLFLHDLVKPEYRDLEPFVVEDFSGLSRIHESQDWPGYWSDPSKATREIGEDLINDFVDRSARIAEMALAGEDLSQLPVYPDSLPGTPEGGELSNELQEHYAQQTAEFEAWLREQQLER